MINDQGDSHTALDKAVAASVERYMAAQLAGDPLSDLATTFRWAIVDGVMRAVLDSPLDINRAIAEGVATAVTQRLGHRGRARPSGEV